MGRNVADSTEEPMLQSRIARAAGGRHWQYAAAIAVSLGAVCAGTTLAWTSPALAQLSTGVGGLRVSGREGAAIGGVLPVGALAAAVPAGLLADRVGRKPVILLIAAVFLGHWALILCAGDATTIVAARFLAGAATGAICVAAPMYIGEIAETAVRGTLSTFFQMFLCLGILLTCAVGAAAASWAALSAALAAVPVMFGLAFAAMPESPVFLAKRGHVDEARRVLLQLRGGGDVDAELQEIQREVEAARRSGASVADMFTSRANRMALLAAVGTMAFQQLCGINAVVFYTVQIFEAAGSTLPPFAAGIIIALVQVAVSYVSIFVIERANRKLYLMMSAAGMLVFLAALGMYFHLKELQLSVSGIGFIPISSAVLFMMFFSIGFGPVPWLLMGELFAPEIKGVASGCAILTNWGFAFLVTFFFPILNAYWGVHTTFYLFAAIMAVATIFIYFVVPETRGKTLLEIQQILSK